jgi:parvulin-like peptidyl-prolyl isomerase
MKNSKLLSLLVFAAYSQIVCGQIPSPPSPNAPAAIQANKPETVLISNSRATVTQADLDAELQRIPEKERMEFLMSRSRLGTLAENILINKVLAQEARNSGLDKKPEVVAEILNQTEKVLARRRSYELRATAKDVDLLPNARQIYILNKNTYKREAQYETWVTLISKGNDTVAARQKAEDVLKRAKAGEALEELAKKYSDDPTAQTNAGLNKIVPLSRIEPNVGKAITKLKPGEFADVVDAPIGYLVVKLVRHFPESPISFDEIKGDLILEARNTYEVKMAENYIDKIRNDPTLKIQVEALDRARPNINMLLENADATPVNSTTGKK